MRINAISVRDLTKSISRICPPLPWAFARGPRTLAD